MVLGHDIFSSERTQDIKITEDVSFDSMLLSPRILKGLNASGFYVPSPIQLYGISMGKCGLDLLLEAKSGTGKTAVFSVIALEKLDLEKGVQTLILAPTREIASQICDVIKTIGANYEGLSVVVVMGGLPFVEDVKKFDKKVHIVVGSPGRLRHLIGGKHIDLTSVRLMVLDEADKLVEKSFLADINYIFSKLPDKKQVIMSSATYPENVKTVISKYLQNPHYVCPDSSSVLLGIEQNVTLVHNHVNIVKQTKNRYEELRKILSRNQFKQCLVFCNYQVRVGDVHRMLKNDKWPADKLFGHQEQTDRLEALKILQEYKCRILVTTDLASRGIDASNVDLVINFEIPYDWQTYLHRIGRAGRYGSYGTAISILSEGAEVQVFKKLLRSVNIPFDLKYLWSREPFTLIDNSGIEENPNDDPEHEIPNTLRIKETTQELWRTLSIDTAELNNNNDVPSFKSLNESFEQASNCLNIECFADMVTSFETHDTTSKETSTYKTVEVNNSIITNNVLLEIFAKKQSIFRARENNKMICDSSDDNCNEIITENSKNNQFESIHNRTENIILINNQDTKCYSTNLVNGKPVGIISDDDDTCQSDSANEGGSSLRSVSSSGYVDVRAELESNLPIAFRGSKYEKFKIENNGNNIQMLNTNKLMLPTANNYQMSNFVHASHSSKAHKSSSLSNKTNNNGHSGKNSDTESEYNDNEEALLAANLPTAFGKRRGKKIKTKKMRDFHNSYNKNKISREQINKTTHSKQREDDCWESSKAEQTFDESDSISYRSFRGKQCTKEGYHTQTEKKHVRYDLHPSVHSNNNLYTEKDYEERQRHFHQWYQQLRAQMLMIERSVYIDFMST